MTLPPELQAVHDRLNTDLPYFLEEAPIMVLNKQGLLVNFRLNQAQRFIHKKLEEQKKKTGMVRALILKGRQEGCSLYLTARNYHLTTRIPGLSALLISHQGQATQHLFSMISRYHKYTNPLLRPETGAANRTQLKFSDIESQFTVGTAGNEDIGRSSTNQIFHWSEAAYTDNAPAIQDGAMQTIPNLPGTEIVLESTANGPVGLFYNMCQDALHGRGEYQLVFVPWWWMDEYEALFDDGLSELSEEEQEYAVANLGEYTPKRQRAKLLWRRNKIFEFADGGGFEKGVRKFRQIYPANPIEAFQASGEGLFNGGAITAARKSTIDDEGAPLIMGVDSAGNGMDGDRTIIVFRRGRRITDFIPIPKQPNMDMAVAGVCIREINARGVDMCFVDIGYGHGTVDRLHELGYRRVVQGVSFSERAMRPDIFLNKRSEMIVGMADWVNGGDVRIPDDNQFHSDLASIPLDRTTSNGLRFIVPTSEIKKLNHGKSTDILDAAALTFAYPVRRSVSGAVGRRSGAGGGTGEAGMAGWRKKDGGKSELESRKRRKERR
jgi:hypothetical protein